ncbi:RiPP maturation radical SAM C-methyltransferase [Nonomuraea fuscirosea]|uniref:RiPP maturation radical SAM C-methyltransferase n=1 Tax=Nonomuraea fuscirosea TaxID=1291556 RepID=UPI00342BE7EB
MRTVIVNMPWSSIEVPSLAVGILAAAGRRHRPDDEITVLHANLEFVDWVCARMHFDYREYQLFSLDTYFTGCGDWIFTSALHGQTPWRLTEFSATIGVGLDERDRELAVRLHSIAPEFVEDMAQRIVRTGPQVVGLTSTFQQNVAALAVARRVKELDHDVVIVLGGANCDGAQGAALHRNFEWVDYVVRGEGDVVFPELLDAIDRRDDQITLPGVCWRTPSGETVANSLSQRPLPPAQIAEPTFDLYFERLAGSVACEWVEPKLVVEGARGCWWGEKHHCKFCGLNGSSMKFRSKSAEDFFAEVKTLAQQYQVLDFYVVDNIIDMDYLRTVLPRIVAEGLDYRLHYEIKSNMRLEQLRVLREAGAVHVQPGIESLSSSVLRVMDKGVTGCLNVRLLRDASSVGIAMYWNYLYGFPGERADDYKAVVEQLPALYHLAPPATEGRIAIERFSPYFDRPELGFGRPTRAAAHYYVNFDLPDDEVLDLAYIFEAERRGIEPELASELSAALERWRSHADKSFLTYVDRGDRISLYNLRPDFDWQQVTLSRPVEVEMFRLLMQPRTIGFLARKLSAGHDRVAESQVGDMLGRWAELGLTFTDGDQVIQVAPSESGQRLFKVVPDLPGAGGWARQTITNPEYGARL